MRRSNRITLVALLHTSLALIAGACASSTPVLSTPHVAAAPAPARPTRTPATHERWPELVSSFIESYLAAHPSSAVSLGRHEFDGQLPDFSRAGIARDVSALERARERAAAFPEAELSADQRFERAYLLSRIDTELFWLRDLREPFVNPAYYFDSGLDPNTYVNMPYAPADVRLRAFIAYAQKIPAAAAHIRANLELPLPRTFIAYATLGFSGFAQFYRSDVPRAFAQVESKELQAQLAQVIEPAARAMTELASWLEGERPRATDAFAIGPERFAQMLQLTERVDTPLSELLTLGQQDLARNQKALTEACAQYAPKASVRECVTKQERDKPSAGAVVGAREQLDMLRQFIVDHRIVSIPDPQIALVAEAPAYRRQNFAYIDIPGPFEKNLPAVYYIAPPDPNWSRAEQDAYIPGKADLMFTSVHEVWPGHFLQFLHSNRAPTRFGQIFVGYAFAEGWAHYAEELMIEEGLAKNNPALHIGQLLNALLRNVRLVCAIGLHTQNMSVAQCENLFGDQAYQDAGNARQQAARGTYDPAYLNYTLGKLLIRKLRKDWQAEHPSRPIAEFHDALLGAGGPPIPLLRTRLLSQPGTTL
jgi:hypothetical protein